MFHASRSKSCVKETREDVFGFIDRTGKIVIDPEYLAAESFHRGLARVTFTKKMYETINGCYAGFCWYASMPLFLITRWMPARACHDETRKIFADDTAILYGVIDADGNILHSATDPGEVERFIETRHPGWSGERRVPAE
jgi:hypothetical protein